MRISLQGSKLLLTDALKEYTIKRLASLDRFLKRFEHDGEVLLEVEIARVTRHHRKGDVYYVEFTLSLPKKMIRIEHTDSDVRAGIDAAHQRLKVAVEEYKHMLEDKQKTPRVAGRK